MILTPEQANSIYQSMCLANNLGGRINVTIGSHTKTITKVDTREDGSIVITGDSADMMIPIKREFYSKQAEFAAAYNLQ